MMAEDQVKQSNLPSPAHYKKGQETLLEKWCAGRSSFASKELSYKSDHSYSGKVEEEIKPYDSGYGISVSSITSSSQDSCIASDFDSRSSIPSSRLDSKSEGVPSASIMSSSSKWRDAGSVFDSGLGIETLSSDLSQKLGIEEDFTSKESISGGSGVPHKTESTNIVLLPTSWKRAFESDQDGDTMLHLAVVRGVPSLVVALISAAPSTEYLDIPNNLNQTALHLAVLTGQDSIVRKLVLAGVTLDSRDRHGNTALHLASQLGDIACARALLTPVRESEAPHSSSLLKMQYLTVDLLELTNYEGKTCVHIAACYEQKKMLEYLVGNGADINAKEGKSGRTALHYAVEKQKVDLVDFLIKRCHADLNIKNYAGLTPLHVAWKLYERSTSSRLTLLVKKLREYGGKPSERPDDSDSESESELSSDEDEEELKDIKLGGAPL